MEAAVGILKFANPTLTRFQGMVKKRYSDFIVDEIDASGVVAQISSKMMDADLIPVVEQAPETSIEEIKRNLTESIGHLLLEDDCEKLVALYEDPEGHPDPFISQPIAEKEDRTKFHTAIRTIFNGRLVSDTQRDCIRVAAKADKGPRDNKRAKLDRRNYQDRNKVPLVKFVLRKEFLETLEATQIIAKKLGINPKDISVAGTKDKRAVTTQFVTMRHMNPAKLAEIDGIVGGKIRISDIRKCEEPLKLGDLSGNRFTLLLRDVKGEDGVIKANVKSLAEVGFINYYGLQRFGSMSVKSHDIGIHLLRGEWATAIDLILAPRSDENDAMAIQARKVWAETGDAKAAHDLFPFRYNAERQILWHFHKQGNQTDLVGALLSINRELRLMYVHSVQSLVWNRLVSKRLELFGMKAVPGDIVLGPNLPPTILTEENAADYTIYDVAMPLPGYDVKTPGGDVGGMYHELVEQELHLVSNDCFQPKTKALWDLPGAYRHMLAMPKDVDHAVGYYDQADHDIRSAGDLKAEGPYKAVRISFSLSTSSYATMALREIMDHLP